MQMRACLLDKLLILEYLKRTMGVILAHWTKKPLSKRTIWRRTAARCNRTGNREKPRHIIRWWAHCKLRLKNRKTNTWNTKKP